jgi:hypothetical protein
VTAGMGSKPLFHLGVLPSQHESASTICPWPVLSSLSACLTASNALRLLIGLLFRRQVGLEDRFEHQNCRRLYHTILDRGHS